MRRRFALFVVGILFVGAGLIIQSLLWPSMAQETFSIESRYTLPSLQAHPLPPTLGVTVPETQDDYFDAIAPVEVGYLLWTRFPVTVFVEPPSQTAGDRSAEWVEAVMNAVQEWQPFIPLEAVASQDEADIVIWRKNPPLRLQQGSFRARSAETRYELYVRPIEQTPTLAQRMTIWLRPAQSATYLQAAARHELGHALGIWGHSPLETDALYASQVHQPAPISGRDINTLRRVYQQPTRLGWPLSARTN